MFSLKMTFNRNVPLPTTMEAYDALVAQVASKGGFTDTEHVSAVVSTVIRRLPNDQANVGLNYLANSVHKNIANGVANHKAEMLQHAAGVKHLKSILEADPSDTQARDQLQKAANDGSELASAALAELDKPKLSVVE